MRRIFTAWNLFLHNLDTSELWNWTLSCHGLFASELSSFELQILELFELLELLELVQEETRAHCDLERKLWCRDTKTWKNVEHIILPGQTSHPPLCSMAWKTLRPCSEDCSTYQVCSVKKKFIQSCIVFTVCTWCVFYEYNQTTCLFISIIHIPFYTNILCSISSTVKLSRLPLTSFRKPCCLRLSISGDSWEAKVWDQHDQRKGRITSGSCGWKRFTDCSIPYALSRDHQPSDINSVPTCPKQIDQQQAQHSQHSQHASVFRFFLFFHLPHRYVCLLPTLHGDSAKRRNTFHGLQRRERFGVRQSQKFSPSLMIVMLFLNLRSYESYMNHGHLMTLAHFATLREMKNKNRGYNLGGNLAVHPLLGKRFQILWLLNHAFRSLKGATKSKTHNSMERKTKSSSLRVLPKCSESVQGVRSILVQRCHHNIGPKQCSLSCNRVTANCHDAMICDVSCCANLRLLLIFWNLWRLLLQWLMYLKHQACDHCDSLFNDFNVCFCVFAYGKTWKYGKSMILSILSEAVKHPDWGVHHLLE